MNNYLKSLAVSKTIIFISILLIELILNNQQGLSQILDQPSVADSTKEVKVIEPVQLSNIGVETESTNNTLREIRNKIKQFPS